MKYRSTRGGVAELTGAKAIIKGIADDKGLFVPACIPELPFKIEDMTDAGYRDVAKAVIGAFFDDYTEEEMAACVNGAYDKKFTASDIVEISEAGGAYFLELFHGGVMDYQALIPAALAALIASAVSGALGVGLAGCAILFLYNGRRAQRGRRFSKWFFYLFYPGHLLILALIRLALL